MQSDYFIIEGWFENTNGLHNNKFYGAYTSPSEPFKPRRIVLEGSKATEASKIAASNHKININEIAYDTDGLTKSEREDSEKLMLDDNLLAIVKQWAANYPESGVAVFSDGNKILISFGDWAEAPEDAACALQKLLPQYEIEWDYETGCPSGFNSLQEMVSAGAISMPPGPVLPTHMDKSRLGMSDRGGHGHIDNMGPKKVKTGKNIKGSGRNKLQGFGDRASMKTISQFGGQRGGNKH